MLTAMTATLVIAAANADNTAINSNLLKEFQTLTTTLANKLKTVQPASPPASWHLGKNIMYKILPNQMAYTTLVERCGQILSHVLTPDEVQKINFSSILDHRPTSKYIIETRRNTFHASQNSQDRNTWASTATKCKTMSLANESTKYINTRCDQPATAICVKHTKNVEDDSAYLVKVETINQLGRKLSTIATPLLEQAITTLTLNPQNPSNPTAQGSWDTLLTEAKTQITATIEALPTYPTILQALTSTEETASLINKITLLAISYQVTYHAQALKVVTDTMQSLAIQDTLDVSSETNEEHQPGDLQPQINNLAGTIVNIRNELNTAVSRINSHKHPEPIVPALQVAIADIQTLRTNLQRLTTKVDGPTVSRLTETVSTLDAQVKNNLDFIRILQNATPTNPQTAQPANLAIQKFGTGTGTWNLEQTGTWSWTGSCNSCTVIFTALISSVAVTIIALFIPAACLYRKLSKKLTQTRTHLQLNHPESEQQTALLPDLRSRMEGLERAHNRHLLNHTSLSDRHEDLRELIDNIITTKKGATRRHQATTPL